MKTRFALVAGLLALSTALSASSALAQTSVPTVACNTLPSPVYVAGSSALRNFVGVVGKLLAADAAPTTVVYQSQGSCTGVQRIYDADPTKRVIKDIPSVSGRPANYAIFFKTDGTAQECFLESSGNEVNIGLSDVYAKSCGITEAPAGVTITDYPGPVQPMTFVVPAGSKQTVISADAAYLAFGLGGATGTATPWIDPRLFFVRNASSGTQQMLATAIGVPGGKWWGVDRGGSGAVRDQLKIIVDPAQADAAIGILSTDVADADRANLRVLAFKAKGQTCGYLPDSSATSRDKQNVRDGHYEVWGPAHILARTSNGTPVSTAAQAFLARFVTPRLPDELLSAIVDGALVPQCAMRVTRNEEVGPLASFQPPYSCGCYFDQRTRGSTTCKACKDNSECPSTAPTCNFGYCEVR